MTDEFSTVSLSNFEDIRKQNQHEKTNILDVQLGIHLQPGPFSSQPLLSFRVLKVWVPMI